MRSRIVSSMTAIALFAALTPALAANPVPFINQPLAPDAKAPGGTGFKLTVNGTGFVSGAKVNWNGSPLTTKFVSGSLLNAAVPASDIATAGTASVTVVNPSPGGGTSNTAFFSVTTSTPAIALAKTDFGTLGGDPEGEAVADFNGDGKLDLVVANAGCCGPPPGNTLAVLLGNGDGTFQPAVLYNTGNKPMWIAVGDFNGDGKLDVATANQLDNTVSVLVGNGDGTFQAAVSYSTGSFPETIIAADFNMDGKLDLAVANSQGGNTVSILLGNGDGTFQPHVDFPTGVDPRQAIAGDFNGDGKLDLATTNYNSGNSNTVSILLGNGDGTFQSPGNYPVGIGPFDVTAADFNGDGKLDLAVTNGNGCCVATGTVSVLLGNGDGTFQAAVDYPTGGSGPTRITAADLNGDSKVDLAATDLNGGIVSILLGNGDGTFGPPTNFSPSSRPVGVLAADFNGDGRLDLAVTASSADTVSVLLQSTSVSLSATTLQFGTQVVGTSSASQTVTLTNGLLPLTISGLAVTGTDAADFSQTNTCGSGLAAGASCTITVTFTPAQTGPLTAAVTITDNAGGSPQSIALSGTGVSLGPNVTLSPTSLTFPTELVGVVGPAQPVTLTNDGSSALRITSIKVTGAHASEFGETNTCHSSLAPAASCTINVIFSPNQRGSQGAALSIADNAPGSPQAVNLQGTGTVVALNPASLNFGNLLGGSKTLTTTLTNVGSGPISISGISVTGTGFAQTNTCGSSLAAGASCTISVAFTPPHPGGFTGAVSISDNGGGSPQTVSLSGTGIR